MNLQKKSVLLAKVNTRTAFKMLVYGLFVRSFYYKMRSKHNG